MFIRILSNRAFQCALLLLLLAAALFTMWMEPEPVARLRQMTFDTYNSLFQRPLAEDTAIVDIDEESLKRFGQWPWPRNVVGDIPLILKEMGAKAVAFDVVFAEPDRTSPAAIEKNLPRTTEMKPVVDALKKLPDNDQVFANKISRAGNVVLAFTSKTDASNPHFIKTASMRHMGKNPDPGKFATVFGNFATPLDVLGEAAAGVASIAMEKQGFGVIRKVPLLVRTRADSANVYPALSIEALRIAIGAGAYSTESFGERTAAGYGIKSVRVGKYAIPTDENGMIWVYYTGHTELLKTYIPAWKVLSREVAPEMIRDKIVFVGTSAEGLKDLRASPLDSSMPGVEVHAEIVQQILQGKFLRRTSETMNAELMAAAALSLGIIFIAPFVSAALLALVAATIIGTGFAACAYAYQTYGFMIDPLCSSLVVVVIFILSSILTNLRTEMEKRMIRKAFSQYLSPVLIEELAKYPERLKLGGEVRELSVMFTDIRNFTTISESMDPAELIRMMNDFLTPMTSAVLDNKGFVDKYMGDAMMTFWNAPVDDAHHAQNACRAALEMVAALKPVNAELKARAEKAGRVFHELKAGIGINSGRASVGNMGSKQRFAYSALGDTVNLASRLEGQTKVYGVTTMIAHSTKALVPQLAAIELDLLTVKGRTEPERIYTLLGDDAVAKTSGFVEFAALHARMLEAYRAQKWEEATRLGDECAKLKPELAALYRLYTGRIAHYKEEPPGPGWTGVWIAKEK